MSRLNGDLHGLRRTWLEANRSSVADVCALSRPGEKRRGRAADQVHRPRHHTTHQLTHEELTQWRERKYGVRTRYYVSVPEVPTVR